MHHAHRSVGGRRHALLAGLLAFSLLAAGCGGEKADDGSKEDNTLESEELSIKAGETRLAEAGDPVRGGTLTYGMEADSNDGFCLPEAQLAISGMLAVRAVYDTLTMPNAEGEYVPYLAKSLDHNDDYKEWTIGLRDGVKFHDGTDLTAEVVKNNIDAYRGKYPTRSPLLFAFVLSNIADVSVVDPLTVKVTMTVPWVAFPAYLYSSSRFGIMAQSQLDDTETCDRKLVGTGPFTFDKWVKDQEFDASRNEDYWQIAPDGEPYPYVDKLVLKPMPDGTVRNNALEAGEVSLIHTSNAEDIGGQLKDSRDAGDLNMLVSEDQSEPAFLQVNNTVAPFDDVTVRRALAMAMDRDEINDVQNDGLPTVAAGPFATDSVAYEAETGYPAYDLDGAKKLVKAYEDGGGDPSFTLLTGTDPATKRLGDLIRQAAESAGFSVTMDATDQAKIISKAIAKDYSAMLFRNFPGGDPDINHVWWYGEGNPVNFAGFDDPDLNELLDEGRSEVDPDKRAEIYKGISKIFGEQVYYLWLWYTPWAVVEGKDVHGILGPPLPGADVSKPGPATTDDAALQPSTGLATAHSLLGLWIDS